MKKHIIILNGSPRLKGNTAALAARFQEGAEKAGHSVSLFSVASMNIHGCLGCCRGGKDQDHPCVQRDDMDKIYAAYQQADIVVLASPMYYWGISGQLKCTFDRLFAVAELDENYANPKKEAVLLMAAEGDTEENFEPVRHFYQSLLKHLSWEDRGIIYAGGNMEIGDIAGKEELEKAFQLGLSLQ